MKVRQKPIAAAVTLALLSVAFAAQAQQAETKPASKEDPKQLDQVVITGIRASQEKALSIKRNADAHIDVITAEDIGKMPDKNVADSLARIPGVSVLNSPAGGSGGFDERDRVGLRGTNPSLTQTLINGHAIASGDWFVLDQTGAGVGRSVSYSLLPSELVNRVELRKSSEASLVEGGTAGSVNIVTRKPLDFSKSLTIEAGVGMVYADLPAKTDPQLSVLANFKNEAKTFGVLIQAFSEKRHLRRDGVETLGYRKLDKSLDSTLLTAHPDLEGVWAPTSMGAALFQQVRERNGGLITLQLKPTKDLDLALTGFSSKMDASNYNNNYLYLNDNDSHSVGVLPSVQAGNALLAPGYVVTDVRGVKTLTKANFTSATAGTPFWNGEVDAISRPTSAASSNFINFDGKWKVNDDLSLTSQIGTSKGRGITGTQDIFAPLIRSTSAGYQLNGSGTAPTFNVGVNPADANNATNGRNFDWIWGVQNVNTTDKENWLQIDGEYAVGGSLLNSLKFGLRQAKHDRYTGAMIAQAPGCTGNPNTGLNWGLADYYCPTNAASPYNPANLLKPDATYPGDFGSGLGSVPANIAYYTQAALAAYGTAFSYRDPVLRRYPDNGEYAVSEKTTAAYLQGNLEGQGWSGNIGLRLVRTEQDSANIVPIGRAPAGTVADIKGSLFGDYATLHSKRSYTDLLPSASIRVEVAKDVIGRLALSKTLTRPDYTALSGFTTLGSYSDPTGKAVGSGSAGNPELKPLRSTNFDANLEWYFAPRAFVSMGAFHMQMGSYITDGFINGVYRTEVTPAGAPAGTPPTIVNAPFRLLSQVNKKASVTGLEFGFEMPVAGSFGVNANYTFADGHDEDGHVLRGATKHTANLGGFFENDQFSARLNYSYRSDTFIGLDRNSEYSQKGGGVVSASLGYKINSNFSLSLDALNLNNPTLKYFALNDTQPRGIYTNGRQYYLTARMKF